jgi:hypothetical protein
MLLSLALHTSDLKVIFRLLELGWVGRGLGSSEEIPGWVITTVAVPAGIGVLARGIIKVPFPPTILLMPG